MKRRSNLLGYLRTVFSMLVISTASFSADFFTALDYSRNNVSSDTGFYDSANAMTPGLTMGWTWDNWKLEAFYRQAVLENTHTEFVAATARDATFDIELDTRQIGLGMRYSIWHWFNLKFGAISQRAKASYTTSSGYSLSSLINDTFYSYYVGGSLNWTMNDKWSAFFDTTYYAGDNIYSVWGFETGIRYTFYSVW